MISVKDKYFSFIRFLLLIVGLWPYQKSKLAQFHSICFFSIIVTCIIFQFTTFITSKYSVDLITKVLSSACPCICLAIKYNSFCVNSETVKYLMKQLQCIYDDIKSNNEIAIIEAYGNNAKRYAVVLTAIFVSGLLIIVLVHLWPILFHINLPINQSRPYRLYIMTEYFVDQERYFYLSLLHIMAAFGIGIIALLSTGIMLIAYLQHACGMFRIASYRIEHAIQSHTVQDIILPNKNMVHKRIIRAIDIHRKAMMFSQYLIKQFEMSFMFLIVFGVITLSLNIFQIFQAITLNYDSEEFFMAFVLVIITMLYMFLSNYIGQEIIDHNNHIFYTAYNIQWYMTPLSVQKLILLILQRGNKSFGLNVGGLFIASLHCFAALANASISYFTVMYSVR